jgi:hypothetical protein
MTFSRKKESKKNNQSKIATFFGVLVFLLTGFFNVSVKENKASKYNTSTYQTSIIENKRLDKKAKSNKIDTAQLTNSSEQLLTSNNHNNLGVLPQTKETISKEKKFLTILPLDKVPIISIGFGESAQALMTHKYVVNGIALNGNVSGAWGYKHGAPLASQYRSITYKFNNNTHLLTNM